MSRLIGLGGKLRAGKDAVGDYLEEKHDFVKLGMSDALNEALLKLNPWIPKEPLGPVVGTTVTSYERYQTLHDAVGYVEAKKNPEVRRLLQVLGTEVGRDMIDPDVWVNIAEKKIREHWANGKSVVITAMRFPNEIEMLQRMGGFSVWVERPEAERLSNGLENEIGRGTPDKVSEGRTGSQEAIQSHASENSVSANEFEYVLVNDGTLDQLYRKVEKRLIEREGTSWINPKPGAYPTSTGLWQSGVFAPPYDR